MNTSLQRFESKFKKHGDHDCWSWEGPLDEDGYGRFQVARGWAERAHRQAWIYYMRPLKPGRFVLHNCGNRACVNPKHLYLGTRIKNTSSRRTHCPANHPYKGDNLYIEISKFSVFKRLLNISRPLRMVDSSFCFYLKKFNCSRVQHLGWVLSTKLHKKELFFSNFKRLSFIDDFII